MNLPGQVSEDARIKVLHQARVIIWLALCFVVLLYAFIAYQQQEIFEGDINAQARLSIDKVIGNPQGSALTIPLSLFSVFIILMSFLIPNFARKQIWEQAKVSQMSLIDIESRLFVPYVLAWTLVEAVATMGYIISYTSHSFLHFLPFGTVALVLMFIHRPKLASAL